MFATYVKVALLAGMALAIPFVVYQGIMFVVPGLTPKERRYVYIWLPYVALSFAAGVLFGFYIVLPSAVRFLLTFGSDIATPQIRIGNYISTVSTLLFWMGVVFELPVVLLLLTKLGVLNRRILAQNRKYAVLVAFALAAIITPTPDPLNQTLVAVPIVLLYELSIFLARFM